MGNEQEATTDAAVTEQQDAAQQDEEAKAREFLRQHVKVLRIGFRA